jgi:hypothetical protein
VPHTESVHGGTDVLATAMMSAGRVLRTRPDVGLNQYQAEQRLQVLRGRLLRLVVLIVNIQPEVYFSLVGSAQENVLVGVNDKR